LQPSSGNWTWYGRRNNGLNQYTDWTPSIMYYDDNFPQWGPLGNGVMMADGWVTASYNALNQPIAIWSKAYQGHVPDIFTWFGFDPLGRCVKRWVGPGDGSAPSGITYLYYDGWNLIQEGPSAYTADRQYIHGARVDEIVKQITPGNGSERFFHYDARTHCTLQTDAGGGIVEQYSYGAFGQPHYYDGAGNDIGYSPWGNRFLFTGREWLSDLKLYDYRNRLYQPELGRFLQPDPKEFSAGDYNLYRYCHNDPVNHSDPTGLYVSGLTSWGGGDWIRGMNGLTNRDTDLINQARLTDFLNSVKPGARDAATASHSTNVEYGGSFANSKQNPNDLARGPMTASTEDIARNPQGTHGVMNETNFESKPLPPGHGRLIGGYWGLARWQSGFPYGDKHALWTKHWSAVLGVPRPEGQHGQPDVHVFQYRPGMAEPRMDEP
jgi:RHS repeat-associated protein